MGTRNKKNPGGFGIMAPRAYANGIPVWCAYDELVNPKTLVENPKNPNEHPPDQVEEIGNILEHQGWRLPITISNQSGMITRGAGRLKGALFKGWNEVPIDRQDYESPAMEMADLVADNRLAEKALKNKKKLDEALITVNDSGLLELTGYSMIELEEITNNLKALSEDGHLTDSVNSANPDTGGAREGEDSEDSPGEGEDVEIKDDRPEDDYGESFVCYLTFQTQQKAHQFLEKIGRPERFRSGAKTLIIDMDPDPGA